MFGHAISGLLNWAALNGAAQEPHEYVLGVTPPSRDARRMAEVLNDADRVVRLYRTGVLPAVEALDRLVVAGWYDIDLGGRCCAASYGGVRYELGRP